MRVVKPKSPGMVLLLKLLLVEFINCSGCIRQQKI